MAEKKFYDGDVNDPKNPMCSLLGKTSLDSCFWEDLFLEHGYKIKNYLTECNHNTKESN